MNNIVYLPENKLPSVSLCDRIQCETGFVHPDRIMDMNVLLYVEKGSFHIFEEEPDRPRTRKEYTLDEGSLLFLKQGMHHFGDIKCPDGTKWFFVHFTFPEVSPYATEGYELPKYIHIPLNGNIYSGFTKVLDHFCSSDYYDKLKINSLLYQVLMDIYCMAGLQSENIGSMDKQSGMKQEYTDRLRSFLETQKREPFSSSSIEEHMGLSYKHLNLIFKSVTGITLQKYHAALKLDAAARMLRETNLSVDEIGRYFGFDDPGYFSNTFKKHYGTSPSVYRQSRISI